MKTHIIDWDAVLQCAVRRFPHLQRIVIQATEFASSISQARETLVEFVAHLGEAWTGLGGLLELYYGIRGRHERDWSQVRLDTVIDEIRGKV